MLETWLTKERLLSNSTPRFLQNAAARLVFSEPKRAHVRPLFISLYWLAVAARMKFKTLMLAYRTATGSAPVYFHSLLQIYIPSRSPAYFHSLLRIYIPSRSLRSASERRLVVPSQRGSKSLSEHSRSPFLAAGMIFPPPSGMDLESLILKYHFNIYLSLLPLLACTYLNNAYY